MKISALVALLVLGSFGCTHYENRSQLFDEIIEAQGLREQAEVTKVAVIKYAKESSRMSYEQLQQRWPDVEKEVLEKCRVAQEKYVEKVSAARTVADAELRQILAETKFPLDKKQLATSKRAL